MEQMKPPTSLSLEGNLAENWRVWIQRFELFLIASGIGEKSDAVKRATFLHVAGDEAIKVFNTFNFDEDVDDYDVLKEMFRRHCEPRKNVTYLRHLFFTRVQGRSETVDAYVTDLKNKARDCEFEHLTDSLIRDRVVCGIMDDQVRGRLLREPDLTLNKAIDICRASELSRSQLKSLQEEIEIPVHKVTKQKQHDKKKDDGFKSQSVKMRNQGNCTRCGYKHEPRKCPAYGQVCKACHRKNHYAKMCITRRQPDNHKVQQINKAEAGDQEFFIGSIQAEKHEHPVLQINAVGAKKEKWQENLIVNKKVLKVRLDTGADCNVISMGDLRKLRLDKKVSRSYSKLVAYSGQQIQTKGKIMLTCQYKDKHYDLEFEVIKNRAPAILGGESCEEMGLVKRLHVLKTESDILGEYEDLFTGLGCLPGVYHIKTDPDVSPVVHAPRKVPVALKDKIETELKRMESLGVITKQTEPTDWVNSMVTVTKPNKVRICIDPQDLNTAIKREHYPLRTIEEVVAEMPNAKYFSVLDANHGFWQIRLDEESSHLCTFNTPFGRYRFNRLPFGISSAPEVFQRCIARHLEGLEGVVNVIDDILVWGESIEQHDRRLRQLLERIRSINLKLNKSKCKIRMTEIAYIGHVLSEQGLKPDPEKVRAIQDMPAPEDKAALQRFTGLLQYLSKFIPNLSEISAPLRKLEGNVDWLWGTEQQQSFDKLKALVSQAPVLKYYDVNKPVTLSVDASSEGLGAVLLQEGQPVAYGSRALTDCQKRYAQIEKELLAIVFGCEKFHQYLYGRHVHVESDHKPLEVIFKKSLLSAPARLQRMLMRLQKYSLEVKYKPGKEMHVADALSRAFLKEIKETLLDEELEVNCVNHQLPVSEEKMQEFRNATAEDAELGLVANAIQSGWPEKQRHLPDKIKQYWTFREELAYEDGLIFKNSRLVVPHTLRSEMLRKIHESHLGIVKCKERARDVLYWPGMAKQIEDVVAHCAVCNTHKNCNPKEPLMPHPVPERAWEKIGVDLFHFNDAEFLLCVDYFSKYPEIVKLSGTSGKQVIIGLKSIFARHGVPDELFSDNGRQLVSQEMVNFSTEWGFKHTTSSPTFPQSNGQAERAVQTIKNLLKKAQDGGGDPYLALLDYRNTPLGGVGLSPAQLLLGRRLKSKLPVTKILLQPALHENARSDLVSRQQRQKQSFDQRARTLSELQDGDNVRIRQGSKWEPATVIKKHNLPRSYIVTTPSGQVYRRNRRHLLQTKETSFPGTSHDTSSENTCEVEPETTPGGDPTSSTQDCVTGPQSQGLVTDNTVCINSPVKTTRCGRPVRKPQRYQV